MVTPTRHKKIAKINKAKEVGLNNDGPMTHHESAEIGDFSFVDFC